MRFEQPGPLGGAVTGSFDYPARDERRDPHLAGRDPLITIAIPTRNRAKLLQDCVASALAQTYGNIEVLVSDNASTDGTLAMLGAIADERLRVVRNRENIGMVRNFARCVDEARGDYLVLIADDNLLDPTFLEKCVALVRQEPGLAAVLSLFDIHVLDEFGAAERRRVPAVASRKLSTGIWAGTEVLEEYLNGKLSSQLLSSIIRTDILRRNGYSTHPCAGDEATWIPVLLEGRVGLVNERCAIYLVHDDSASAAFSADSRFMDLCAVMDEISASLGQKLPKPATQEKIRRLTSRYVAHQAMITLVLYRRTGARLSDVVRKLRKWRPQLERCSLADVLAVVRLRSLGRILLPPSLARWSMALGLDRVL
ncbi:MAG: glycosyltransferase family 2 protein [Methyloceanibacter sp.]